MKTKTFKQSVMIELARNYAGDNITVKNIWDEKNEDFLPDEEYQVIVNEHYDNGRWKSQHHLVFLDKQDGKYYYSRYENGLTESQYYTPYCDEKFVECDEVTISQKPVTTIVTTWDYT